MSVSSRSEPRPSRRMGRISVRTGKEIEAGEAGAGAGAEKEPPPSGKTSKRISDRALRAKTFQAAAKSAEFLDHLRAHYRETRRTPVEITTRVKVLLEDGSVFAEGRATIKNVSPSGALLSDLNLNGGVYPTKKFKLELLLENPEYQGIGIEAVPIRFVPQDSGLGVKFEEIFVNA